MSTLARIAVPHRVRIDYGALPWADSRTTAVVHVGQSAVVLAKPSGSDLVVVTAAANGLMPGGICLPDDAEFAAIRAQIALVDRQRQPVDLSTWMTTPPRIDRVDLSLGHRTIDRLAIRRMRDELTAGTSKTAGSPSPVVDARPIRARATRLATAAIRGRCGRASVPSILYELVGAGPGTTPTGDDVIVGVMAGLHICGNERDAATIAAFLPRMLPRTTTTSRHYLNAAIAGRFGEHVHELVRAATGKAPVIETVARAARWGATSGTDLLAGLLAAVQAAQLPQNTSRERSA